MRNSTTTRSIELKHSVAFILQELSKKESHELRELAATEHANAHNEIVEAAKEGEQSPRFLVAKERLETAHYTSNILEELNDYHNPTGYDEEEETTGA